MLLRLGVGTHDRTYLSEHDFIALMVIQVETYFVTSATLNGIWCIVTVSDLQQQQRLE